MNRFIIKRTPSLQKGVVIEHDGEEIVCFSVTRNGDDHGPERVQLWCVIGTLNERGLLQHREFVPYHFDTKLVDADAVTVIESKQDIDA